MDQINIDSFVKGNLEKVACGGLIKKLARTLDSGPFQKYRLLFCLHCRALGFN